MNAAQAPDFLVVGEHIARNPVARAVARKRIEAATRDFLLRMYLLADGTNVQADAHAASVVLAVGIAIEEDAGRAGESDSRVMAGGMSTLVGLSQTRFQWHHRHAAALDVALQRALDVLNRATALQVQDAHRKVAALSEPRHTR